MKKVLSLLLATVMLFNLTACSKQKIYTAEDVKEMVSPYMSVLSIGISDGWCGSAEDTLLSKAGGAIFKSILENIYRIDNNADIYNSDYKVNISDYVNTAAKYFNYDKEFITEHFRNDTTYDAETSLLSSSDGLGNVISIDINSIEAEGDIFKINYNCFGVEDYYIENYGFLTVEITEEGTPRFLSNTVNETQTQNPQTSQPQATSPAFERMFDWEEDSQICLELISMFALSAYDNWSLNNEDALLNCGKGTGFPGYINTLYSFDTGKKLIDKDGYAHIDDMVKYAEKYFDINENIVRKHFERHPNYNSADGTILFDGGIGNVTGVHYIEVTEREHNGTVYYHIDYAITEPEEAPFKYATLTYTKNDDGSFKFMSNRFHGNRFYPSYESEKYLEQDPVATSKDGAYSLYYGNRFGQGDSVSLEYILKHNNTDGSTSLGFVIGSLVDDAGFFANGDAYTMDYTGLNVFRTSNAGGGAGEMIFTTKTNFPGGVTVDNGPYSRYIFAVRRDPVTFEYIVIYSDCSYHEQTKQYQLNQNYRVGLLDKDGKLTKSWDTGVPVIFSDFGFESVYMTKPSDIEIEFFVKYQTEERLRGRFNLENGEYTSIKEFVAP